MASCLCQAVIYGERDWMSPAHGVEVIDRMKAAGRSDVAAHVLPLAGHYAFIDQPTMSEDIIAAACAVSPR